MFEFDALVSFMMGLVIIGMVTYVGVAVMGAATSEGIQITVPDIGGVLDGIIGWIPTIIVAIMGCMVFVLLIGVFGDAGGPPSPSPTRRPSPNATPRVSDDEVLARDPEIVAMTQEIRDIGIEITSLREARRQHLAGRPWRDRAVLWLKRRSHRQGVS